MKNGGQAARSDPRSRSSVPTDSAGTENKAATRRLRPRWFSSRPPAGKGGMRKGTYWKSEVSRSQVVTWIPTGDPCPKARSRSCRQPTCNAPPYWDHRPTAQQDIGVLRITARLKRAKNARCWGCSLHHPNELHVPISGRVFDHRASLLSTAQSAQRRKASNCVASGGKLARRSAASSLAAVAASKASRSGYTKRP